MEKSDKTRECTKKNLIYWADIDNVTQKGGCYVFYNKHGESQSVLYIGKAENLKRRIEQQFNNLKLMIGIKNSVNGKKYLMYCEIQGSIRSKKFGSNLKMLEKQLIKSATLEGQELLNQKGTKIRYKRISFKGNRDSEDIFGRKMNIIS